MKLFCKTNNVVVYISFFILFQCVYAEPITDPLQHFLATPDSDREIAAPNPKTILKMVLDISGDGRKSVFLSGYGDRSGYSWTVYLPVSGGYAAIREINNHQNRIVFDPQSIYIGSIDELHKFGLVCNWRAHGGAIISAYWFSGNELSVKEIGNVRFEEGKDDPLLWKKYFSNGGKSDAPVLYPVEELSVDDLRSKGYFIHTPNK